MKAFLDIIAQGNTLTEQQAETAMHQMLNGTASSEAIAGLLMGLRSRGETLDEITGFTRAMRTHAVRVECDDPHAIDLCGTGGDASGTFNISTAAAFVCAGAGATVVKHGNRAISSRSGSADVLEALGVNVSLGPEGAEFCLRETGLAFLNAPSFHPAMRYISPVRKALRVRTCFNILGPMCNPAGVKRQIVGAFDEQTAQMMSQVMSNLGAEHIVAIHGAGGVDELSIAGPTAVFEYTAAQDSVRTHQTTPEAHGLGRFPMDALAGGSNEHNAEILRAIFDGQKGAPRSVVLFNAAYGLYVSGRYDSLEACFAAAREAIDSGAVRRKLEAFVEATHDAPQPA